MATTRFTRPPDALLLDQMLAGGPSSLPAREPFRAQRDDAGRFESLEQLLGRAIESAKNERKAA